MSHIHEFAALWSHYGPYGPQDVHYHPCISLTSCNHVILGPGRVCDGDRLTHNRTRLGKHEQSPRGDTAEPVT